jgi:hypothetical protein
VVDDGRVALADAGRFDDHQVVAGHLGCGHDVVERVGQLARRSPGGERAEIDRSAVERVHADAVAQERPTAAAAGRVDRDHRDAQRVGAVEPEATDELVGQRRLA